jgi:hypothetical protein
VWLFWEDRPDCTKNFQELFRFYETYLEHCSLKYKATKVHNVTHYEQDEETEMDISLGTYSLKDFEDDKS